jgi:hypothetical protein
MLLTSSLYLKVSPEYEDNKSELASGVIGAIVLYIFSALASLWYIYKTNKYNRRYARDVL